MKFEIIFVTKIQNLNDFHLHRLLLVLEQFCFNSLIHFHLKNTIKAKNLIEFVWDLNFLAWKVKDHLKYQKIFQNY